MFASRNNERLDKLEREVKTLQKTQDLILDNLREIKEQTKEIKSIKADISELKESVKADISEFKESIKADMSEFKESIKADMSEFKESMKADMSEFKESIKADMSEFKESMKTDMSELKESVDKVENRFFILVISLISVLIGFIINANSSNIFGG